LNSNYESRQIFTWYVPYLVHIFLIFDPNMVSMFGLGDSLILLSWEYS